VIQGRSPVLGRWIRWGVVGDGWFVYLHLCPISFDFGDFTYPHFFVVVEEGDEGIWAEGFFCG
jgi:hypothetical protein